MKDMSTSYELTGRTSQKARTRSALVAAARALLAEGVHPTVEQAADRAEISRTTAYRYFKNQRALRARQLPRARGAVAAGRGRPGGSGRAPGRGRRAPRAPDDRARARAARPAAPLARPRQQAGGPPPAHRAGRSAGSRTRSPRCAIDLTDAEFRRLVLAIRAGCGIEALIWLTDIAGLSREEAVATMSWSARTLVESATARRRSTESSASVSPRADALERERGQADGDVLALPRASSSGCARPRCVRIAWPAATSVCPPSCSTRSEPLRTSVYSSNAGVWNGSSQPAGARMCAMLIDVGLRVHAADVLVDQLATGDGDRGRAGNQAGHRRSGLGLCWTAHLRW